MAGDTVVATARLEPRLLYVETNSLRRADSARQAIEAACGGLLRFKARELVDPLSERAREAAAGPALPPQSPEEMAVIREWKRSHYAAWVDEKIPALGGKTPRQAMRTARGRKEVDALLRDIEHLEARLDPEERFDLRELRLQLGLE